MKTPTGGRHTLEQVTFRALFLGSRVRQMLFTGCDTYMQWYPWIVEGAQV